MVFLPNMEFAWDANAPGGTIELLIGARFPRQLEARLESLLGVFCFLGSCGMLAGERFDPARSLLQHTGQRELAGEFRTAWSFRWHAVDAGSFRLLLNAILHEFKDSSYWLGVSIKSDTAAGMDVVPMTALSSVRYPGISRHVEFDLEDNLTEPLRRHSLFRAEFVGTLTDDVLDRLCQGLAGWERALKHGSYAELTGAGKVPASAYASSECYRISPLTAEYSVYDCSAPREAMHLIVNLLVRIHRTAAPVRAVEFE